VVLFQGVQVSVSQAEADGGVSPGAGELTAEAVGERLLEAAVGTADLLAVYLGDRLGWYASLRHDGPATPEQLAARTGTAPRYAREWLEQQAVTGLLTVESDGRFGLPAGVAEALTNPASLVYVAPLGRMLVAPVTQMPALLEAYRSGGGVSWAQLGADARESQADMNRPWYESVLPGALAGVPHLHGMLGRPGARIAEIGCGGGWASLTLARAYPLAEVTAYDIDSASVELAAENVRAAKMAHRVRVVQADAAALPQGEFDVLFAFECLHDMPYPVEVLAAARSSLRPGGAVVVMDEAVADQFRPDGDLLERLMYGFSLLVCLPDGLAHPGSAGTGTVMREHTLRSYAEQAGFAEVSVLPIQDFGFWRFYELREADPVTGSAAE
jgi:predicted O-methyltransferase YrrM